MILLKKTYRLVGYWRSGLPAHLRTRLKGAPSRFRATGDIILSAPHVAATALLHYHENPRKQIILNTPTKTNQW